MMTTLDILKVPAVNGAVLAVTVFSQIQVVLSCILLAATIFWTCIKIAKARGIFTGRNEGGYFVGLLEILHFGNAFWSSAICTLVRSGLDLRYSGVN